MSEKKDRSPSQELLKVINQLLEAGSIAAVITVMTGPELVGSKLIVEESGRRFGTILNDELDSLVATRARKFLEAREDTRTISLREIAMVLSPSEEILLLFERLEPARHLVICGAGHVGAALAKLGSLLGYQTILIDDRSEFLRPDRFPQNIELVVADNWGDSVRTAVGNGKGVALAVVTRGHNQDEECMHAIKDLDPDYIGLIGSKRRTNIVIDNLRQAGVAEEKLKSIRAPIGLDIGAVTPEEVALAIIAEIVAERHGRAGGSLSAWRRLE
ncbi:MAG TPA: XdhC/CoxI family protein [Pyrinomonadaceae bacterium]